VAMRASTRPRRLARRWYVKWPLDFYALGPVDFDKPVGERTVRKQQREWEGVSRLPKRFECWPAPGHGS